MTNLFQLVQTSWAHLHLAQAIAGRGSLHLHTPTKSLTQPAWDYTSNTIHSGQQSSSWRILIREAARYRVVNTGHGFIVYTPCVPGMQSPLSLARLVALTLLTLPVLTTPAITTLLLSGPLLDVLKNALHPFIDTSVLELQHEHMHANTYYPLGYERQGDTILARLKLGDFQLAIPLPRLITMQELVGRLQAFLPMLQVQSRLEFYFGQEQRCCCTQPSTRYSVLELEELSACMGDVLPRDLFNAMIDFLVLPTTPGHSRRLQELETQIINMPLARPEETHLYINVLATDFTAIDNTPIVHYEMANTRYYPPSTPPPLPVGLKAMFNKLTTISCEGYALAATPTQSAERLLALVDEHKIAASTVFAQPCTTVTTVVTRLPSNYQPPMPPNGIRAISFLARQLIPSTARWLLTTNAPHKHVSFGFPQAHSRAPLILTLFTLHRTSELLAALNALLNRAVGAWDKWRTAWKKCVKSTPSCELATSIINILGHDVSRSLRSPNGAFGEFFQFTDTSATPYRFNTSSVHHLIGPGLKSRFVDFQDLYTLQQQGLALYDDFKIVVDLSHGESYTMAQVNCEQFVRYYKKLLGRTMHGIPLQKYPKFNVVQTLQLHMDNTLSITHKRQKCQ